MRIRTRYSLVDLSRQLTSKQALYTWDGAKWSYSTTVKSYYKPTSSYPYDMYDHCTDELHKGPPYKSGGPFDLLKIKACSYQRMNLIDGVTGIAGNAKYVVSGYPILIYSPWVLPVNTTTRITALKLYEEQTNGSLDSHAQGMYDKCSPLKPRVDLGQFISEFGDIPRMLRGTAKMYQKLWRIRHGYKTAFGPKNVADEWLNNQFGWVPFLSTIVDTFNAIRDLEKTLDRLRKYNGQWETRRGRMKTIVNDNVGGTGTVSYHFPVASLFTRQFTYNVRRYATRDEWFIAKYRYYIPELGRIQYPTRLIREIMGLRISPQLLWDLVPWSWLIDWFVNMRDLLARADDDSTYQLVSKDAYAMGKTVLTDTVNYKLRVAHLPSGSADTCYGVSSFPIVRLRRIRATPYGFGVHSTDLSPWKVSILASLGLSMRSF